MEFTQNVYRWFWKCLWIQVTNMGPNVLVWDNLAMVVFSPQNLLVGQIIFKMSDYKRVNGAMLSMGSMAIY